MLAIFFIAFLMLLTAKAIHRSRTNSGCFAWFAAAAAVYSALLCVKRGVNHWPARALWPRMQQPLLATAATRHGISQDQRGLAAEQVVYSRNYGNWKHVSVIESPRTSI